MIRLHVRLHTVINILLTATKSSALGGQGPNFKLIESLVWVMIAPNS